MFPLVQLPKKFKVPFYQPTQTSEKVSISSTSEEVQSGDEFASENISEAMFPLVQLPKKFKALLSLSNRLFLSSFH